MAINCQDKSCGRDWVKERSIVVGPWNISNKFTREHNLLRLTWISQCSFELSTSNLISNANLCSSWKIRLQRDLHPIIIILFTIYTPRTIHNLLVSTLPPIWGYDDTQVQAKVIENNLDEFGIFAFNRLRMHFTVNCFIDGWSSLYHRILLCHPSAPSSSPPVQWLNMYVCAKIDGLCNACSCSPSSFHHSPHIGAFLWPL